MKKGLLLKEKKQSTTKPKDCHFCNGPISILLILSTEKKIKSNPCHKLLPPLVKISLWFAEFNHAKNAYFN